MDTRQFIDLLGAGETASAKEALENILSNKAFDALEARKQEVASSLFGGVKIETETDDTGVTETDSTEEQ